METTLLTSQSGGGNTSAGVTAALQEGGEASDLFTTLLVAQIRNQNPLEPTDPSQFVNQLTQLSQMESLQSLAAQTAASTSMMESMQVIALGAQVGSQVAARTDSIAVDDATVDGSFALASASAQTTLVLTGTDGVEHRIELGTRAPGEVTFSIDPAALGLAPGRYALSLKTDTGETPSVEVAGRLESVRLSATGGVVLNVAGIGEIAPEAVTQFNGRS